jgi:hypothetical protein
MFVPRISEVRREAMATPAASSAAAAVRRSGSHSGLLTEKAGFFEQRRI